MDWMLGVEVRDVCTGEFIRDEFGVRVAGCGGCVVCERRYEVTTSVAAVAINARAITVSCTSG